jgi:AcrR family transcriptional regulator
MSETPARPARKDSARNRARLLVAAREVFAERGFGATLDDIAHHAGVGVGTAYRHFPNKKAIAAEVLSDATREIAEDARRALDIADPWTGLVAFFEATATRQAADRGLYQTLTGQGDDDEQAKIWPEVIASVTALYTRAARAGVLRADAAPQDIAAMLVMLGPAYAMAREIDPDLWRRYLHLMLDGLRATGRPALPAAPPPLAAVDKVLNAGKYSN